MAASNRILSLDLGTQTVSIAEFQTEKNGGLVLTKFRSSGLIADPAHDASRLSQTRLAINELVEEMGVSGSEVTYSVSAQAVFTRFVKLPSVGEEQAEQIVTFEAQQNVPFPIDEVVWDYQLVDNGTAEVEVVLVAIKSDLLDEINEAVEESGLRTNLVDVSPMALYNAYRYNYSDQEGCSLIIDVGARTTNLIFVEPKKVFSRSIPIGGTKLTEAIAKDFNEPFATAEERKKDDGFVSLGGAYADPEDPDVARVSKMIRNSMTRLHSEIARSITFYRTQQHGVAPAQVYLCGGSVSLPYMREFFHEKLQLPVEFFNPLRNVTVGPDLDVEEIGGVAHTLGEVVGLALRNVSRCPMELSLRPAGVVRRQRLVQQRPFVVLSGVCVLLVLLGWFLYFQYAGTLAQTASKNLAGKVVPLSAMDSQISTVRQTIKTQQQEAEPLLKAVSDRDYWTKIINDIHSRVPEKQIWVVSFSVQEPKVEAAKPVAKGPVLPAKKDSKPAPVAAGPTLMLKGLYLYNPQGALVVDEFVAKLSESSLYEVNREEIKRTVPNDTEWAFEYTIPLILKTSIGRK